MVAEEVVANYLATIIICNLDKLIGFITMQKYMYYENDEVYYKAFIRLHHQFDKATYKLNILVLLQEY